jgi:hypothetical protein
MAWPKYSEKLIVVQMLKKPLPCFFVGGGNTIYDLLEYNVISSGESQQTFRRKISPLFSGLKSEPNKKPLRSREKIEHTIRL